MPSQQQKRRALIKRVQDSISQLQTIQGDIVKFITAIQRSYVHKSMGILLGIGVGIFSITSYFLPALYPAFLQLPFLGATTLFGGAWGLGITSFTYFNNQQLSLEQKMQARLHEVSLLQQNEGYRHNDERELWLTLLKDIHEAFSKVVPPQRQQEWSDILRQIDRACLSRNETPSLFRYQPTQGNRGSQRLDLRYVPVIDKELAIVMDSLQRLQRLMEDVCPPAVVALPAPVNSVASPSLLVQPRVEAVVTEMIATRPAASAPRLTQSELRQRNIEAARVEEESRQRAEYDEMLKRRDAIVCRNNIRRTPGLENIPSLVQQMCILSNAEGFSYADHYRGTASLNSTLRKILGGPAILQLPANERELTLKQLNSNLKAVSESVDKIIQRARPTSSATATR